MFRFPIGIAVGILRLWCYIGIIIAIASIAVTNLQRTSLFLKIEEQIDNIFYFKD